MPKVYDNATPSGRYEPGTHPGFMEVQEPPGNTERKKYKSCKVCGLMRPVEMFPDRGANARICSECMPGVVKRREIDRKEKEQERAKQKRTGNPRKQPEPTNQPAEPALVQIVRAALAAGMTVEVTIK